jgi:hypothetical protein
MGLAHGSLALVQPWSKGENTLFVSLLTINEDQQGSRLIRCALTVAAALSHVAWRPTTPVPGARSSAPGPRPFDSIVYTLSHDDYLVEAALTC